MVNSLGIQGNNYNCDIWLDSFNSLSIILKLECRSRNGTWHLACVDLRMADIGLRRAALQPREIHEVVTFCHILPREYTLPILKLAHYTAHSIKIIYSFSCPFTHTW